MPELPEVETVRRGLAPSMDEAVFTRVETRRPDLRYDLPANFAQRLKGAQIHTLGRRGKYLLASLSTEETLIMHLGMSGRFTIEDGSSRRPGDFSQAQACDPKHDHVVFHLKHPSGSAVRVTYNDPRRFGFMDLAPSGGLEQCRHFKGMGPEPLSNHFSESALNEALRGKTTPIKAALLDQRIVAGLGNIYVCEALFRARVSPRRRSASVAGARGARLQAEVVNVLNDAIAAGGSSLRDFAGAEGGLGYFQHNFDVYGREGEPCRSCGTIITRIVQSGRSTFYCGRCQR